MSKQMLNADQICEVLDSLVNIKEMFEDLPSVSAVAEACAETLKKTGLKFEQSALQEYVDDELYFHGVVRHDAPWFSRGIKRCLKKKGYPVTIKDSLDEAFFNHEEGIYSWIQEKGLKEAALSLETLWGPDCGYFYVAKVDVQQIYASWKRLGII